MSKQKKFNFPDQVFVTHEYDDNDRDGDGYLIASEDADGAAHGEQVAIYHLDSVMTKAVRHTLEEKAR